MDEGPLLVLLQHSLAVGRLNTPGSPLEITDQNTVKLFNSNSLERRGRDSNLACLCGMNKLLIYSTIHSIQQKQQKSNLAVHAAVHVHPFTPLTQPSQLGLEVHRNKNSFGAKSHALNVSFSKTGENGL